MNNRIVAITDNPAISSLIKSKLERISKFEIYGDIYSTLGSVYSHFPDLIIIEIDHNSDRLINIINDIKSDSILGQITILSIIPDNFNISSWEYLLTDDYIRYSDIEKDLHMRVELALLRSKRMVELNPLTRLPSNTSITKEIIHRIEKNELFGIAYADLDYFKPYNDKYGFSRGDEVIKMLGRLIFNIVRQSQPQKSFVGHIGGDDFIYIMDLNLIENTSKNIIEHYDKIIPAFYDQADREQGHIESIDREGVKKIFPIMFLSIGITHNKNKKFLHYAEVAEVLAEMKKYAKSIKGSYLIMDRRR